MRIKRGLVIVELITAMVLASFNVVQPTTEVDYQQEELPVVENISGEYDPSVADRIYHFENKFETVSQQAWVIQKTSLMSKPFPTSGAVSTIVKYETLTLTGTNDYQYWRVSFNNKTYYIDKDCITTDYQVFKQVQDATKLTPGYNGPRLNSFRGTINGPSGKETYYNLYMGNIINIMRRHGNYDKYWIRDDGVKMLGDYVMVAASLDIRPRNSLIPTSLGMGIVCDTGAFALTNKTQLDIAVNW